MKQIHFLVLFALLTLCRARPENGYNYPQQQQPLQLNYNQASALLSQQQSAASPQLLSLSESQQSSSYQQGPLQLPYNLPNLPAPSISQAPVPLFNPNYGPPFQQNLPQNLRSSLNQIQPSAFQQQSLSIPQQQINFNQAQHSQPQIPQNLALSPQILSVSQQSSSFEQRAPQPNYGAPSAPSLGPINIDVRQNFPQIPSQVSNLSPQLQGSSLPQVQFSSQSSPQSISPQGFGHSSQSQGQVLHQQASQPIALPVPSLVNEPQGQILSQNFQNQGQFSSPASGSIITKHIYVHVAPEDPLPTHTASASVAPVKKNYKIIFIKAPSQSAANRESIRSSLVQQQVEEKTLVYVLVNKPEQPEILPTPAPLQPSKPEVYFIKYKANVGSSNAAPSASGASSPSAADFGNSLGEPVSSGESTSSLFSGGLPSLSSKYGPPGYQKRSTTRT